jgi:hypothetical protein
MEQPSFRFRVFRRCLKDQRDDRTGDAMICFIGTPGVFAPAAEFGLYSCLAPKEQLCHRGKANRSHDI